MVRKELLEETLRFRKKERKKYRSKYQAHVNVSIFCGRRHVIHSSTPSPCVALSREFFLTTKCWVYTSVSGVVIHATGSAPIADTDLRHCHCLACYFAAVTSHIPCGLFFFTYGLLCFLSNPILLNYIHFKLKKGNPNRYIRICHTRAQQYFTNTTGASELRMSTLQVH